MTPSFETVPENWKAPFGPYRQAPPEYGSRWYKVNPFTGLEPWKDDEKVAKPLPEGFVEIFGKRPTSDQFHGVPNGIETYQVARDKWDQDRRHFKQAGVPPGVDATELKTANAVFKFWGMGEPKFYEGRYGWKARFPESQIPNFEGNLDGVFVGPHVLIAQYQIKLLDFGIVPEKRHPYVPPQLWPDYKGEAGEEPERSKAVAVVRIRPKSRRRKPARKTARKKAA